MGNETTQPGVEIDSRLWKRFREDVRDRRGRIRGVLAAELENALVEYLEASAGGDTVDRLERLEDLLADEVGGEGERPSPARSEKEKNSASSGKLTPEPEIEADGGVLVDDRHLREDDDDQERSVVERRTDAAVAELLAGGRPMFALDELDEAIEEGAGVHSEPSLRRYRKRVLDRLGGDDEIVLPAKADQPLERRVWVPDDDRREEFRERELEAAEAEAEAEGRDLETAESRRS